MVVGIVAGVLLSLTGVWFLLLETVFRERNEKSVDELYGSSSTEVRWMRRLRTLTVGVASTVGGVAFLAVSRVALAR